MPISFDRNDPVAAEAIIAALYPAKHDRSAVLNQLLISTAAADAVAPNAWSVTLNEKSFRVNAGQTEVFVAAAGGFFLNCAALAGVAPFDGEAFEPTKYKMVQQPQCRFWGVPSDLANLQPAIQKAHMQFVGMAARSASGKPRTGTSLRASHSEGLLIYAKKVVGAAKTGT